MYTSIKINDPSPSKLTSSQNNDKINDKDTNITTQIPKVDLINQPVINN